jgi:voltage-gated potassium channel
MAILTRERVRLLYNGSSEASRRFRYALLALDVVTISFLVFTSFVSNQVTEAIDAVIGVILVLDFGARLWIAASRWRYLTSPYGLADVAVIISLLAPIVGEGLAFLRAARLFRLFRSVQLVRQLREDIPGFRQNEQALGAAINLGIFLFVSTALVYQTQHGTNPKIGNYVDALYFTVTTLTTTGFGDITLEGHGGRLLSVVIMIFGVSLFLRLIQLMLRPSKVEYKCPDCGLTRHDPDAVHCKACGRLLNIEDEGFH